MPRTGGPSVAGHLRAPLTARSVLSPNLQKRLEENYFWGVGIGSRLNVELRLRAKAAGEQCCYRAEISAREPYCPANFSGLVFRCIEAKFCEENTRWKALAEIYTIHSFAP